MKFLLKLILGLLIFVILAVGIPLTILYFTISDSTDNAPTELYTEDITLDAELTKLMNEGFDLENKDLIDFTFTEDEMNKIIFSVIRDSINKEFSPNSTNKTDANQNIMTTYIQVPVLGKKKVIVKNIYSEIENDELGLYVTMNLLGIKTRGKMIAKFSEDANNFKIKFETLGVGKSNLLSGIANKALLYILKKTEITENTINKMFEDKKLPFLFEMDDFSININKDEMNLLLKKVINPDGMEESSQKEMLTELLNTLTSKENDLTDFGVFGSSFGIRFDLKKFKVDESLVTLNTSVTEFNKNLFIKNKVQGFVLSNLSSPSSSKIVFTNTEFNQIVYNQSNAYESFKINIPIPKTTSNINLDVTGIIMDFNADDVIIRININLNGLKTSIKINGDIVLNNGPEVRIKLADTISLGEDIDEAQADYIKANTDLILSLLGDNINDIGVMQYVKTLKSFVISAASFEQLMKVEGTNQTPLTVNKIKMIDNGIEVYAAADPGADLFNTINEVTTIINDVLATNDLTAADFDITDPNEAEVVNNLINNLDTIAEGISNNTLTEENTNQLIDVIGSLSEENRQTFLNNIEESSNSSELLDLYNSLFGK
jgi:hypothetical protein